MADRYWVGGTNTWDTTAGTKWSATDGGAGGASVPTTSDNVYIKGSGITITASGSLNCLNLNFTGFTGTFTGSGSIVINGIITLSPGLNNTNTGAWTWGGTSGATNTITSYGKAVSRITMNGSGVTFRLIDKLTISFSSPTSGLTLVNGSFDANGQDVELTGAISFIKYNAGALTFYNLIKTGTATKTNELVLGSNITVLNNLIINGNSAVNRIIIRSDVVNTRRTITAANVSMSNVNLRDIAGAGAANWNLSAITGLSGDCGGNSGITFTAPSIQTWNGTAGGNYSTNAWSGRVPLPQDTALLGKAWNASQTVSFDMPDVGTLDFTGTTGTPTFTLPSFSINVYGSLMLSGCGVNFNGYGIIFMGRGNHTFVSGGSTIGGLVLDAVTGSLTCLDNINSTGVFSINSGTLTLNNIDTTFLGFRSNNTAQRTINMGNGTMTLTGTTLVWDFATITNLTFNCGLSTIKFTNNSATAKPFAGGGLTYYKVWNATLSTGTFTITGNNTFNTLKADSGRTIRLTASTTTRISAIEMNGATLQSTTTTNATLDLRNIVPMSALASVTRSYITVINAGAEPPTGTKIYLGAAEVTQIYLGNTAITHAYIGTTQIF